MRVGLPRCSLHISKRVAFLINIRFVQAIIRCDLDDGDDAPIGIIRVVMMRLLSGIDSDLKV